MGHKPPPEAKPGQAVDPASLAPSGRPVVLEGAARTLGRPVQLDLEGGIDWEWLEGLQRSQRWAG